MSLASIRIRPAGHEPGLAPTLAEILIDCVEGGASVSFMWPLAHHKALAFWKGVMDSALRGERIVLLAEDMDSAAIVGTVHTVTHSDAERLYPRLGWRRPGVIPRYALWPHGGLCDTTFFYKALS
jgi:hypothetical protein